MAMAKARAPLVSARAEVTVMLVCTPGVDDVRDEFRKLTKRIDAVAAASGVHVRIADPLGTAHDDPTFRELCLTTALDCAASADIIVGVSAASLGTGFPSASEPWQIEAWRRAAEVHPKIAGHKGRTLFDIVARFCTAVQGSSGRSSATSTASTPPSLFCFEAEGGDEDEENVADILTAGDDNNDNSVDESPLSVRRARTDLKLAFAKSHPIVEYSDSVEAAHAMVQHIGKYLEAMLPPTRSLAADDGIQARHAAEQREGFVEGGNHVDRIEECVARSRVTLVRGPPGAGKSAAASVAAEKFRRKTGDSAVVITHNLGLSWESGRLARTLKHLVSQLAPYHHNGVAPRKSTKLGGVGRGLRTSGLSARSTMTLARAPRSTTASARTSRPTAASVSTQSSSAAEASSSTAATASGCNADAIPVLLNDLTNSIRYAAAERSGVVIVMNGIDHISPQECHIEDFIRVRLTGPESLATDKCLEATSTIYAGNAELCLRCV